MLDAGTQSREFAFSTREVQERFKLAPGTTRKLIREGVLEAKLVGAGRGQKYLVLAESLFRYLRSDLPAAVSTSIAIAAPREIIALSSVPFMSTEERAEIEERRASGELVEQFINGLPALVSAPVGK